MRWLTNLLKNALAQAATEVLLPQMEQRMREMWRKDIREEMQHQFEEVWLPRLREMWRKDIRAEMQHQFEEVWLPQIDTRIREIVRAEMKQQFEEVWLPQIRSMWKDDLMAETRSLHSRLDAIATMVMQVGMRFEDLHDLKEEVRSIRSEVDRIKAHVGLN